MNATLAIKQTLRELLTLAEKGEVPHKDVGICANVMTMMRNRFGHNEYRSAAYMAIEMASLSWPEFSGSSMFPVGGYMDYIMDRNRQRLWSGRGLTQRISLLRHLVNETGA